MKPRRTTYLFHRWLGLIVSLQLLAWSVGGFMFSELDLDNVRGERDIASTPFEPLSQSTMLALPDQVRAAVQDLWAQHLTCPHGAHDDGIDALQMAIEAAQRPEARALGVMLGGVRV